MPLLQSSLSADERRGDLADVVRAATSIDRTEATMAAPFNVAILLLDEEYGPSRFVRQQAEEVCKGVTGATLANVSWARLTDNTTTHIGRALNADLLVIDYGNKPAHSTLAYNPPFPSRIVVLFVFSLDPAMMRLVPIRYEILSHLLLVHD